MDQQVAEYIRQASLLELSFLLQHVSTELCVRHERMNALIARNNVLTEERCIMAFNCSERMLPKKSSTP